jgi:hypothetical protein
MAPTFAAPVILVILMRLRATTIAFALLSACLLQGQTKNPNSVGEQANPAAAAPEAPPFASCAAGGPLGAVDLRVEAGGEHLPFRTINHLSEGDNVLYSPILRGKERRPGDIALVLVPEKRQKGQPDILVTEAKPADKPQQWKMSETISLAALVYGPAGLSRKKVAKFLSQDEVLVAQLADYADKTAQAEQLVTTLSNSESSSASVNAALSGFASEYGFAVQINRSAPVESQAATVFAAMNPQLAAYNPLVSSTAQSVGQTASLATMAGTLFFGSPVGLAAGGTAMLLDLRAIAFPDTQFRASFAAPLNGSVSGVNLCGQQGPVPAHTRVAYIWASRIPNIAAPAVHIGEEDYLPAGRKTALPVEAPDPGWKYLDRARQWTLVANNKKYAVPVVKLGNQKALELDLAKSKVPPGDYKLSALWDWVPLQATGIVHVLPLSDFKTAQIDPASQDRLLAGSGKVPVTLKGSDFEFTTKIELQKLNDEFATPETVRFLLPKGLRKGPQEYLDLQIDTGSLDPGAYKLLVAQEDGKTHPVDFKILPNPPKVENLPILANQGIATQHFILKGERLGLLTKLEAPGAVLKLSPAGANQTERSLTVELQSSPKPGEALPVTAYLQDHSAPLTFPDALEITGPLPVIASTRLSLPTGIAIAVRGNEFPAGYTLNAMLDVKNIERQSVLHLACADGVGQPADLHIGEQSGDWNLQQLSHDQLFLAFDTSDLPAGCSLQAAIDNGREGASQAVALAHVLRLPQIDFFTLAGAAAQNGARQYHITGKNLELIAKLGWDDSNGVGTSGLPTPLPGPGLKQSITINLPDPPAADDPLYVWLWGDKQGRATTLKAPPLPQPQATTTSITSAPDPSVIGQAVTFTASVSATSSGAGTPTGTVTFMDGDTALGTATLDATGTTTLSAPTLTSGTHNVTAVYGGSPAFAGSTSTAVAHVVQ